MNIDYKFLGFHIGLPAAIKQVAEQEEAFFKLRMVCNENLDEYKGLSAQQLNIIRRRIMRGDTFDYALKQSETYIKRFNKLCNETYLTHFEAEYLCDMIDNKEISNIVDFVMQKPCLWGIIKEIMSEINNK